MAICLIDLGLDCVCEGFKTPGFQNLWLANRSAVESFTQTPCEVGGADSLGNDVNSITAATSSQGLLYEVCALDDSLQLDNNTEKVNFIYLATKTLSFKFSKTECVHTVFMQQLKTAKVLAILKDRDGMYWIAGLGEGFRTTNFADLGGTTIDSEATVTYTGTAVDKYEVVRFLLGDASMTLEDRLAQTAAWIASVTA